MWWVHGSKSNKVRGYTASWDLRLGTHAVTSSASSWSEQFTRLFQIPMAISEWRDGRHLMMGGTAKRCGIFARNTFIVLSPQRLGWRIEVVSGKTSQAVGHGTLTLGCWKWGTARNGIGALSDFLLGWCANGTAIAGPRKGCDALQKLIAPAPSLLKEQSIPMNRQNLKSLNWVTFPEADS